MTTLQSQLQTQVVGAQRRQRWQLAILLVVIVAFYVGMFLLKHGAVR